uniref:BMA-LGC-33 n=1 Tax=Brugia malayi TaxID=6279 RepID=A0A0H5SF40_BRUMA|nr:BMA-LGC-33 [Brugia malayi]
MLEVKSKLTIKIDISMIFFKVAIQEHGELTRKFKYYYASVRPQEQNNRVTNINGTFFILFVQNKVHMEIIFGFTFTDERLVIRELKNRFRMPPEYYPWLPEIITHPNVPISTVIYLDPSIGIVDALYRYSVELLCSSEIWRHPFELFQCEFVISNIGGSQLILKTYL